MSCMIGFETYIFTDEYWRRDPGLAAVPPRGIQVRKVTLRRFLDPATLLSMVHST